ncbi:sigma factor-like helix-turn-helix DNA-binding protein [Candidatus Formimonas warabiya]|uniref:RNA polymerase sigma factor 70 region 4 type 2 domain-containing protein n=1 Tax=Formimonas warabiya TaxID=1761012 RepID=A0A3G1KVL0_FORW1|nr:sigma factor-like helix-turn-helix DNA-binding protein [Candidatus Formimonas warabiya]ATW26518.1 hypothetical protein DCMF_18750 [Candidatus Formimonas warabiya]
MKNAGTIHEIIDCINHNSHLVYNLAYRLTGEEEHAVNLISAAVTHQISALSCGNDLLHLLITNICQEYLHTAQRYAHGEIRRNLSVEKCLSSLPPKEKIVLILHDVLKLTRQEVMQILDEPEPVLRKDLYQARNLVKEQYQKIFVESHKSLYSI